MAWGGARAGAGRPARGPIASEPHKQRPTLSPRQPIHVIARLLPLPLPRAATYRAVDRALALSLARADFRIVRFAVLRTRARPALRAALRLELVVEADDKTALARGMQGFQVSAAKALNRACRQRRRHRRGTVFPDRYRMRVLTTRHAVQRVVASLPLRQTVAWPTTWLLRVGLAAQLHHARDRRARRRTRAALERERPG